MRGTDPRAVPPDPATHLTSGRAVVTSTGPSTAAAAADLAAGHTGSAGRQDIRRSIFDDGIEDEGILAQHLRDVLIQDGEFDFFDRAADCAGGDHGLLGLSAGQPSALGTRAKQLSRTISQLLTEDDLVNLACTPGVGSALRNSYFAAPPHPYREGAVAHGTPGGAGGVHAIARIHTLPREQGQHSHLPSKGDSELHRGIKSMVLDGTAPPHHHTHTHTHHPYSYPQHHPDAGRPGQDTPWAGLTLPSRALPSGQGQPHVFHPSLGSPCSWDVANNSPFSPISPSANLPSMHESARGYTKGLARSQAEPARGSPLDPHLFQSPGETPYGESGHTRVDPQAMYFQPSPTAAPPNPKVFQFRDSPAATPAYNGHHNGDGRGRYIPHMQPPSFAPSPPAAASPWVPSTTTHHYHNHPGPGPQHVGWPGTASAETGEALHKVYATAANRLLWKLNVLEGPVAPADPYSSSLCDELSKLMQDLDQGLTSCLTHLGMEYGVVTKILGGDLSPLAEPHDVQTIRQLLKLKLSSITIFTSTISAASGCRPQPGSKGGARGSATTFSNGLSSARVQKAGGTPNRNGGGSPQSGGGPARGFADTCPVAAAANASRDLQAAADHDGALVGLAAAAGLAAEVRQKVVERFNQRLRSNACQLWALLHVLDPKPSRSDKEMLMAYTNKTSKQVTDWFTNWRARHWKPSMQTLARQMGYATGDTQASGRGDA